MATFKARGFRKAKQNENKKWENELRKSGRFNSKPFLFKTINSNILFEKVIDIFKENFDNHYIKGEEQPINSIVENSSTYSNISSPSFVISLFNSWLRITPNKFGGLHISRLQVDENMRGNGIGSLLLSVFSKLLLNSLLELEDVLEKEPVIDLEVLNQVGLGIEVDVPRAVSLYEKFGFRVVESRYGYKRMVCDLNLCNEYILGRENIVTN